MFRYFFDIQERAVALLTSALNQPRVREVVSAFSNQAQAVEDAVWALVAERYLSTASGAQLDAYGVLLDQPREGLNDADYRAVLRVVILANRSTGNTETLIAILRELLDGVDVELVPVYPAGFRVQYVVGQPTADTRRRLAREHFGRAVAAGVSVEGVAEGVGPVFALAGHPEAAGLNAGRLAGDWFNT